MSTPCWQPNTAKKRDELSAEVGVKASRGFEPRSLDSESRVLTVTPRGQMRDFMCGSFLGAQLVADVVKAQFMILGSASSRKK